MLPATYSDCVFARAHVLHAAHNAFAFSGYRYVSTLPSRAVHTIIPLEAPVNFMILRGFCPHAEVLQPVSPARSNLALSTYAAQSIELVIETLLLVIELLHLNVVALFKVHPIKVVDFDLRLTWRRWAFRLSFGLIGDRIVAICALVQIEGQSLTCLVWLCYL